MNLLTRMTLNIGELNKQKFHYNIKDTANPMGSFNFQSEARRHYLFRRKHYVDCGTTLASDVSWYNSGYLDFYFKSSHSLQVYRAWTSGLSIIAEFSLVLAN